MKRPVVAVDYDGTLVNEHGLWLPGAAEALRWLDANTDWFLHTCRGNWAEGEREVREKVAAVLAPARAKAVRVEGKPAADFYVDDRALVPDWGGVLDVIARRGK